MKVKATFICLVCGLLVIALACSTAPAPKPAPAPAPAPAAKPTPQPPPPQAVPVLPTAAPPATPKATPTPPPAPKPTAAVVKPTGELKVAVPDVGNETNDPIKNNFSGGSTVNAVMYDFLVGADPDGTLSKTTGVADDWQMAADGLSWTFHVRKGIKFHNGDPLTAEDVKFSLERFMSKDSVTTYRANLTNAINSIDVLAPDSVRINTKGVAPYLLYDLAPLQASEGMVMPKKYFEAVGAAEFARKPIGSGPFKFVRHVPGDRYEFEAVEDNWRIVPAFQRLTIMRVPEETTRVAMLRTGEVDLIETSTDSAKQLRSAGFEVKSMPSAITVASHFIGTQFPQAASLPTANVKVRQALSLAINRAEIIQTLLGGQASPPLFWAVWPFAADMDAKWIKWSADNFVYNPDKAKQLLKEAGYPNGFSLKIFSFTTTPWLPALNEIIGGYWDKIGVKTEIVPMEYNTGFRPLLNSLDPKVLGQVWTFRSATKAISTPNLRTTYGSKNLKGLNDPEFDKLVDAIPKEPDAAKRRQMTDRMLQIVADSWPSAPIAYVDSLIATSKKVGKWSSINGLAYLGRVFATIQHGTGK